jgi:Leucine rich repeat
MFPKQNPFKITEEKKERTHTNMSILFFLLFLLSCTSSVLCSKDDESVLLKIKKQLGSPYSHRWWVEGFNFCDASANVASDYSFIDCTGTGRVRTLILQNLDVSAPFPDAVCGLTELYYLEIYHIPGLYGPIPSCITKLTDLVRLEIAQTSLSGSVPSFGCHAKAINLTTINLSQNHLSDTIPPSFSNLPHLQYLDLSSNYLTGNIPPGLVPPYSASLALYNNNLTGELPRSYELVDFSVIDVGNNRLHGDASFLFGKQKRAVNIVLANNDFAFDLSALEFSDNLYGFDLSHNNIYGKVPDSFANATGLWYPNLSFNKLCGQLPLGGNMWRFNSDVFVNNTCLCGNPLPPCSNLTAAPAPMP